MKKILLLLLAVIFLTACEKETDLVLLPQQALQENETDINLLKGKAIECENLDLISKVTYTEEQVNGLINDGIIGYGHGQSILLKLQSIKKKLCDGKVDVALRKLEVLILHIEQLGNYDLIDEVETLRCEVDPDCTNLLEVTVEAPTGTYTLYVQPEDQRTGYPVEGWEETGCYWGTFSVTNALDNWNGAENTEKILTVVGDWTDSRGLDYAAKECEKLGEGWYLPAKEELNAIWQALADTADKRDENNFNGHSYWSSTEFNELRAWYQRFNNDGDQVHDGKPTNQYNSCRCVRK